MNVTFAAEFNAIIFFPLFFLVLPKPLESRLNNRTLDLGLCSWTSPLPGCCSSSSTVSGASAFLGSGEPHVQPTHRAELLRASISKVSKFTLRLPACLPAYPLVSAFLGNFVNLNVSRGTPAASAHVENERLVSVI